MARAKAVAVEEPMAGVKKAMDATGEAVKRAAKGSSKAITSVISATAKGTAKGIHGVFYYASFGVTWTLLTTLGILVDNPVGNGIKDGAVAAAKIKSKKRK